MRSIQKTNTGSTPYSREDVELMKKQFLELGEKMEERKREIEVIRSKLTEIEAKKKKLEESGEGYQKGGTIIRHVFRESDVLIPISPTFIQTLHISHQQSEGKINFPFSNHPVCSLVQSNIASYYSTMRSEFNAIFPMYNASMICSLDDSNFLDTLLDFMSRMFAFAKCQQKETLNTVLNDKNILLFNHKIPLKQQELHTSKKKEEPKVEYEEEDDFIAFTSTTRPLVEVDEDTIEQELFHILLEKQKDLNLRHEMHKLVPSLKNCRVNDGLIFIKKKLEQSQHCDLLWILYIKLFCCLGIDLSETTIQSILTTAMKNCSTSVALVHYLFQFACSTGCSETVIRSIWSFFVKLGSTNQAFFSNAALIEIYRIVHRACPALREEAKRWIVPQLTSDYVHFFESVANETKLIPVLSLPSSCCIFSDCLKLVQQEEVSLEDCEKVLQKYYAPIMENEPLPCNCGQSRESHRVCIHIVHYLQGNCGIPFFSSFFTDLIRYSRGEDATVDTIRSKLNQAFLTLLQFLPFLPVRNHSTDQLRTDLFKAIHSLFDGLGTKSPYPLSKYYFLPELSLINTVLENWFRFSNKFSWWVFYRVSPFSESEVVRGRGLLEGEISKERVSKSEVSQKKVLKSEVSQEKVVSEKEISKEKVVSKSNSSDKLLLSKEYYRLIKNRVNRSLQNALYSTGIAGEEDLLYVLYIALECYFHGNRAFINKFHQILRLRGNPLLWTFYIIIVTNCPCFRLSRKYLNELYSNLKDKQLYLKEYPIDLCVC